MSGFILGPATAVQPVNRYFSAESPNLQPDLECLVGMDSADVSELYKVKLVQTLMDNALWKLRRTKVEFLLFTPTVLSFWTVCGFNVADWEPLEFFDYLQWVRSKR